MNKIVIDLYVLLSMYPELEPLPESILDTVRDHLNDMQPKLKTVWKNLKEHNISIPEKRGYSLSDMVAGKLPKNFGQAKSLVEIEQIIIEAAEAAEKKIQDKENERN